VKIAVAVAVLLLIPAAVGLGFGLRHEGARLGAVEGTLVVSQPMDFRFTDPALAQRAAWEYEYATCAKLFDYDLRRRVVLDLASGVRAVPGGVAIRVRTGRRFSDGSALDAADVAWTIQRVRSPRLQSPAAAYIRDVRSVDAQGGEVVLRLARRVPDLRERLALPYFCVVPEGTEVNRLGAVAPPTAGPYYVVEHLPRRHLVLAPNPHYRGPRSRGPRQIVYTFGAFPAQVGLQIERGEADYGPISTEEFGAFAERYGVNRERAYMAPQPTLAFIALNTERPLFRDNPRLRQAVNLALDRRVLTRQLGAFGGEPTDQYLPAGTPGFRDEAIYPFEPDLERARRVAKGHLRHGTAIYYTCSDSSCRSRAEAVQSALASIGLEVRIRIFFGAGVAARRVATRGAGFDLAEGFWRPEYPDPYGVLERLLGGGSIERTENANIAYFHDPSVDRELERVSRLEGPDRYRAFGELDVRLARDLAPIAAYATLNARAFVSARVGCVRFHPVYGLDLAALCLRK